MFSFHFYRWNQFKVFPLACTIRTRNLPRIFGEVGLWLNDGNADNADNSQSQAVSDERLLSHVTAGASNAGSKQLAI